MYLALLVKYPDALYLNRTYKKQEKNDAFYRQHRLITCAEGVKYDKFLTDCNPSRVSTQKRAAHTHTLGVQRGKKLKV